MCSLPEDGLLSSKRCAFRVSCLDSSAFALVRVSAVNQCRTSPDRELPAFLELGFLMMLDCSSNAPLGSTSWHCLQFVQESESGPFVSRFLFCAVSDYKVASCVS